VAGRRPAGASALVPVFTAWPMTGLVISEIENAIANGMPLDGLVAKLSKMMFMASPDFAK
jgi:hypothetical protein